MVESCGVCGQSHPHEAGALCPAIRGVPVRVYGGYLEARAALRANVPAAATRELERLLSRIAEERGVPPERPFVAKLEMLRHSGVITARIEAALFERALTPSEGPEQAWALMSIAEHVFFRLYVNPQHAG